jgi:hypothetical protein
MLSVTVIVCCVSITGGAYMLLMTFFNLSPNKSLGGSQQTLSKAQLEQDIRAFQVRQSVFQDLEQNPQTIADPSK